uniref:Uncharacterized protein n=1 Tax=Schizaphis graminum TaxID=13262 RepID=A0A2S2P3B6_SCHGA
MYILYTYIYIYIFFFIYYVIKYSNAAATEDTLTGVNRRTDYTGGVREQTSPVWSRVFRLISCSVAAAVICRVVVEHIVGGRRDSLAAAAVFTVHVGVEKRRESIHRHTRRPNQPVIQG